MLRALMFASLIMMTSCQEDATRETPQTLSYLAGLMEGTFETPPEYTGNFIRDRRVTVNSNTLEGVWFYTQLNTGADGTLYRQRISQLILSEDGQNAIQKTYGLKTPEKYVDAWDTPKLLSNLSEDDFELYLNNGCEQVWTAHSDGSWTGYVDPQTCIVSSKRRNKDIRVEAEGYISASEYRTNERGYDMDMTFLWGSKPGEMITLYPVR